MLATKQKKKQNLMTNKEKTTKYQNRQFERHHYNAKEQKLKLDEMEDTRKTITVNSQTIDYLQQLLLQINAVSESLFKPKKVLKSVQTQTDIQIYEPITKNTSDCSVEPIKINVNNKIKIDNYNAGKFKYQLTKRNHQLNIFHNNNLMLFNGSPLKSDSSDIDKIDDSDSFDQIMLKLKKYNF